MNTPHSIHIKNRGNAVIDFPATAALQYMTYFHKMEGRSHWIKEGGYLFFPSLHNLEIIKAISYQITNVEPIINDNRKDVIDRKLELDYSLYQFKTEPYEHQERALSFLKDKRYSALFMEQGTGKTKVVLDYAGILFKNKQIDCLLVVAPKGVHRQWVEDQIPKHLNIPYRSMYWRGKMVANTTPLNDHLYIYCFNYESINSAKNKVQFDHIFNTHDNVFLALDESHYIKSKRTKRWKMSKELSYRSKFRMVLTGTPIAKNLEECWSQLHVVNEDIIGIHYAEAFKRRFPMYSNSYKYNKVNNKYPLSVINDFKELTKDACFRVSKSELNLTEKQYSNWYFDMDKKQKKHYLEMRNAFLTEIKDNQIEVKIALTMMQKLQQISNGFLLNENSVPIPIMPVMKNPRVKALKEYIETIEGPIIIWCRFQYDIIMCVQLCTIMREQFVVYGGKLCNTDDDKHLAIEMFLKNKARIFISNPASGGTGLNLQESGCCNAIFFSNSENSIQRWQAEDRIHRIGTKGICNYTNLIAKGSRDIHIANNLSAKKELSEYTLDDIRKELEELK